MKAAYRKIAYPLLVALAAFIAYDDYEKSHAFTGGVLWHLFVVAALLFGAVIIWVPPRKSRQINPVAPEDKII